MEDGWRSGFGWSVIFVNIVYKILQKIHMKIEIIVI